MHHILTHALGLFLLGVTVWLPGYGLQRLGFSGVAGCSVAGAALRSAARWCLGFAFWTAGLFSLAAFGLYRPWAMLGWAAVGLGLAIAARIRSDEVPGSRTAEGAIGGYGRRFRRAAVHLLPSAVFALAVGSAFLIAINPTVSWDASAYHLTVPRLFLEAGGFRPVPMNVYSNWPLATELLFGVGLAFGGPMLAKTVHLGFGLLVLLLLGRAAAAGRGEGQGARIAAAWLAPALFLANGVVLFELKVAYVELAQAFYFLAGLLFVVRSQDAEPEARRRLFVLTGVAAGLLAGVKVTGFVGSGILLLLALPRLASAEARSRRLGDILALGLPASALAVPWAMRNALLTGNPFYPWFWRAFGGPDWSAELGEQLARWQAGIGMGREPLDYLLLPLRVVVDGGRGYDRFDGSIGLFWLLAAPLALWGSWAVAVPGRRLARPAVVAAALSFVFWAFTAQQMRFLIPALAPLALAAALAVRELVERARARLDTGQPPAAGGQGAVSVAEGAPEASGRGVEWLAPFACASLVALFLGLALAAGHGRFLAAGVSHLRLYTTPGFELDPLAARPAVFDAVDRLPPDAALLMLHTNQGFYTNREYLADSFFEASQITYWLESPSTNEVERRLRERGVTHLLIDRRPRGARYPEALLRLLREPGRTRMVHQDASHVLLELRPAGTSRGASG